MCFDLSKQYQITTKNGTNSCLYLYLYLYLTAVGIIKIPLNHATYIKSVEDMKFHGRQNDKMLNITSSYPVETTDEVLRFCLQLPYVSIIYA